MKEIFKDIPGYEGLYQVSNYGRIKSLSRKIKNGKNRNYISTDKYMKLKITKYGYNQISLCRESKHKFYYIHKLVMLAFIGRRPKNYDINHIDGNKANNRLDNLEYITHKENMQHAHKNKLINYKKIKVFQYDKQGNFIKGYESITEAEKNIKIFHISDCINNKKGYNTAGGYVWRK